MFILRRIIFLLLLSITACNPTPQGSADITIAPALAPLPTDVIISTGEGELITYNNATYGYMLEYPSHLQLDDKTYTTLVSIGQAIDIMVFDKNPEIYGELLVIESAEAVMIGVNNARLLKGRFTAQHGVTPLRFQAFVIQNDGRYFAFIGHVVKEDVEETADYVQAEVPTATLALLEQITVSLRFTN